MWAFELPIGHPAGKLGCIPLVHIGNGPIWAVGVNGLNTLRLDHATGEVAGPTLAQDAGNVPTGRHAFVIKRIGIGSGYSIETCSRLPWRMDKYQYGKGR